MVGLGISKSELTDTKTKILAVSNQLFAKQGFDGVSIRDIAQEAEVNVASINYHFKNKLNLFHEIFEYNYKWMEVKIEEISSQENIDTESMAWAVYSMFMQNGAAIKNSFEMIISDHLSPNHENTDPKEHFGPPGGEALLKIITNEVGEDIPFDTREWAMRMLFTNMIHSAIFMNTEFIKTKCRQESWMKPEIKEKEVRMLARALVNHIKS